MKDIFKKKNRNYFSLILLMFFGITAQAQINETMQGNTLQEVVIIGNTATNTSSTSYNTSSWLAMLAANIWATGSPDGGNTSGGSSSTSSSSSYSIQNNLRFTQAEMDKNIDDWTYIGYKLEIKENQTVRTYDGKTYKGNILKFDNGRGTDFYYFAPNASDGLLNAGLYYNVFPSPKDGSSTNPANPPPTPSFIYGADGFPTGNGFIIDATGTSTGITFGTNTSPATIVAGCNPCKDFTPDPNGGNAGGVTNEDAKLLQDDILNILNKSPKFDKFKALLTRGPKNNKQFFSKIPQDKLVEALNDLETEDQRVFATIVANTLNSDKTIKIRYFDKDEVLVTPDTPEYHYSLIPSVVIPKLDKAYFEYYLKFGETGEDGKGFTLNELFLLYGAGATAKGNNVVLSVVGTYWKTKDSSYNEAIPLHEFFGHGRPVSIETPTTPHDLGDAIRFENLVWRLLGKPEKQRDGKEHNKIDTTKPIENPSGLPSFR